MTRLTPDLIEGVPDDRIDLDSRLLKTTGKTVKSLSLEAAGLPEDTDLSGFRVACVPITSGLGVIGGFSASVDAIVRRLGMDSWVTEGTDVLGFSQGVSDGADIIMMSDDPKFIAYNTRENRFIDNSWGTALGYSVALKNAAGGLEGKEVLVIGAGLVGSRAVRILKDMGADVHVTDILREKAERVGTEYDVKVLPDVEVALSQHDLILNAAPAMFEGRLIREGSIFSTPGVPHGFDEEGRRKAKAIIHDPLEIGTAVMAVCSAAFSLRK
ncbi:MAG: 3-methylornithyl-N6-L-lysine dehydrogenase PylD [Candidatus Methanomethylophilaceae archaeon]|nr:3-methylornithyl-N6-L-lysine dehydrogenase PylD [Candidatus Methanomethylophilaceae archaeon]